ncbi:MAG: hypothetical protein ABSG65_33875 [Bryobacteraceae bacterium]|jgi:hypothetical protein
MGAFRQLGLDAPERDEGRLRQSGNEADDTAGKEAGRTIAELTANGRGVASGKQRFRYEFARSTLDVRVFCGQGFSRPPGSIGDWFKVNWKRGGIISYLGPILIEEGYAKPGTDTDRIYIKPFQP